MYFSPDGIGFDQMPVAKPAPKNIAANKVNLKSFMLQHGQSLKNTDHTMIRFEPLFKMVAAGRYQFFPAAMTNGKTYEEVLSRLLGKPITAVFPIPLAQFEKEVSAFSEGSFQEHMASDLGYYSQFYTLDDMISYYFTASKKSGFAKQVGTVLNETLWRELEAAIRESTSKASLTLGYPLHWQGIRAMLYYYLCFALLGGSKAEQILARLEFGIQTLGAGIIILGRLGAEPGTCLLLGG